MNDSPVKSEKPAAADAGTGLASRLHNIAMAVPLSRRPSIDIPLDKGAAYDIGHHDARLAIAEAMRQPVADLEQQRDELLAAFRIVRDKVRTNGRLVGWHSADLDWMNAVIEAAEGGDAK